MTHLLTMPVWVGAVTFFLLQPALTTAKRVQENSVSRGCAVSTKREHLTMRRRRRAPMEEGSCGCSLVVAGTNRTHDNICFHQCACES